ncbi:hypothetical protein L798_04878 [Zootermopsis nevadensis]|uniref:Uncharacterized protein n=1 Tax=Zootermopsis nevadensis TaxID=136037 RepID=A0A067QHL4_ZOONE|nr:hypothetical protein L798_04878 [Zootermopsis nevadensis]
MNLSSDRTLNNNEDSELATCGVDTIDELCENREGVGSGEEEADDECEPEAVPSFAETHAALVKGKSFFYGHNISERERALFGLKRKVSTNQLSINDFFVKRSNFERETLFFFKIF